MKRSTERILTTHTGSLPRPPDLLAALLGPVGSIAESELRDRVRAAVGEVVQKQAVAGIDVVSDGETGKPGFAHYIKDRLTGFQGAAAPRPFAPRDLLDYPDVARHLFVSDGKQLPRPPMPTNDGPIAYEGRKQLGMDLDNFSAAIEGLPVEGFLPAVSPGCVAMLMGTTYYPNRRDFLFALAGALRHEYQAIVDRGFVLQIDCPDLALGYHLEFAEWSISEFRAVIELHVEVLNHALAGIHPDQVRVHVCWGNYPGPHHHDIALADILDIVYQVNATGLSIEGANPRHEHEWAVFEQRPLPAGKVLIPGVIDTCTNCIEHPETVAQRIERYARVVDRERVIAGTDCGFSTMAGRSAVAPDVAYAKLASLAEGARLASARLW